MSAQEKNAGKGTQPDKGKMDDERPIPSQAEGDLETIEEDLREKGGSGKQGQER